jgi:hypothetical protein
MITRKQIGRLIEILVVIFGVAVGACLLLVFTRKVYPTSSSVVTIYTISQLDSACRQFKMDVGCLPPDMYSPDAGREVKSDPPTFGVPMLFGVLPYNPVFQTFTEGDIGPESPQLHDGATSKCLVFFLGSMFTVGGKSYGPWYSFDPRYLKPTGESYPGFGTTNINGRHVRWKVQGIEIVKGRVMPIRREGDVPLYKYFDPFGARKKEDPNNKNYFVYDSYNPGGAFVNYVMHNKGEFDIFSYGRDGLSALDNVPGTENQKAIDALKSRGENPAYYLGAVGDDINNWGAVPASGTPKKERK